MHRLLRLPACLGLVLGLASACTGPEAPGGPRRGAAGGGDSGNTAAGDSAAGDTAAGDTAASDTAAGDTAAGDGGASPGPCPAGTVEVEDPTLPSFCIDRWEATLQERVDGHWVDVDPTLTVADRQVRAAVQEGHQPQAYLSGDQAEAACEAAGKRLCSSEEWLAACRGPESFVYPYGDSYDPSACNDSYPGAHPVTDYFGTSDGVWDLEHMNDPGIDQQPDTVALAGAHPACVSAWGAEDLHGNLHEWVADSEGTFRGGFFADAVLNGPGCTYATTAHDRSYHDYSTGFRCCVGGLDPRFGHPAETTVDALCSRGEDASPRMR